MVTLAQLTDPKASGTHAQNFAFPSMPDVEKTLQQIHQYFIETGSKDDVARLAQREIEQARLPCAERAHTATAARQVDENVRSLVQSLDEALEKPSGQSIEAALGAIDAWQWARTAEAEDDLCRLYRKRRLHAQNRSGIQP